MKILFTFFVASGGVETQNRYRCRALHRHGIAAHQLYLRAGSGIQNVGAIPTWITNSDAEIKAILDREQYDAIVVSSDFWMVQRLRALGYHRIIVYEAVGLGDRAEAEQTIIQAAPVLFAHANAILHPVTQHLSELFSHHLPTFPRSVFHLPFESDSFNYRSYPVRPFPIVGWIGRFEPNKNWRGFLEIGQRLIAHYPNLQLHVFDDADLCPEQEAFFETIRQLGISGNITRHFNVPHTVMQDHLSIIGDSGGFLCSTSKMEGFGYAVLEAMACRCPVLTTDSDGVRSFVTHNVTGKFFPYGYTDVAVAEGLHLMQNHPLREAIRQHAYHHVNSTFSPDLYVVNLASMLRAIGAV
ncbi:glycosyltransferase family 4 protein [Paenibacillus turpanensis]|uniref:glycosyltransferase family 4 protein n=1 Tax=Paenibacillus turpanensis TaxID=2689078 RepID=UPI00140CD8F0|nr:glycosyltransferase family 4 protein [Paenibacillus turpanensis]